MSLYFLPAAFFKLLLVDVPALFSDALIISVGINVPATPATVTFFRNDLRPGFCFMVCCNSFQCEQEQFKHVFSI